MGKVPVIIGTYALLITNVTRMDAIRPFFLSAQHLSAIGYCKVRLGRTFPFALAVVRVSSPELFDSPDEVRLRDFFSVLEKSVQDGLADNQAEV